MSAEELVDIIDEDDRVVGQAPRREIRQHNLRHRCVYILVFGSDGRLLIHQRTQTKDVFPGYWDVAFGGVLGAGEIYDDAALRELQEECGLTGIVLQRQFPIEYEQEDNRIRVVLYTAVSDGPFVLQAEEVVRVEWVRAEAVESLARQRQFCPDGLAVLRRYRGAL